MKSNMNEKSSLSGFIFPDTLSQPDAGMRGAHEMPAGKLMLRSRLKNVFLSPLSSPPSPPLAGDAHDACNEAIMSSTE